MRAFLVVLSILFSSIALAQKESTISLLDNRFRVDPTIEQVTFVIYREERSRPVVLVRPDGKKYYSTKNPDNVRWYQEPTMDIVSIENPMPGPWQAVGKVTPQNKIRLISNLQLTTDAMPERLFTSEVIKFSARLTSDGEPLVLRDFLDRVKLTITFTKYLENEASIAPEARPIPQSMGVFSDDGRELDEIAGDGVFTVSVPIDVQPGKYRVRVTSGNGIFLRAQEQEVLVYPLPLQATFIQSRTDGQPHNIVFTGEQGMIAPGSIAGKVQHVSPGDKALTLTSSSSEKSMSAQIDIPYDGTLGEYSWSGTGYATELGSQRPLIFPITMQTYSVVEELDIEESRRLREEERMKQQRMMEELQMLKMREEARQFNIMLIIVGNVVALVVGFLIWFIRRKLQARKAAIPEMQLDMPDS